ncbi:TPA: hypothetical protein DD449_03910 [Candidatus Berkelbacteria bacterium]|uniref:Porin domain-containing protein n=1 Tax=Berkelbacteria bacterium GW2011_GWE1_39_12 TaxID=1618337 RepID=A0A0G4B316_9BACT|nr:MAG: hypothetical protein UT28_C0001G0418 [Berkelbacteria bacterium GW2011_GWE1_39_12]HBO60802.1 hypothetical protein [Candidatus Berkelbacteria bacterium]
MKRNTIAVLGMALLLAFCTVPAQAGGPGDSGTYVTADVFNPSSMNLDGVDNTSTFFPTDILGNENFREKTCAVIGVNHANIGDAEFDGNKEIVVYQPNRKFAVGIARSSVDSSRWSVNPDSTGTMETSGHWMTFTSAYQASKKVAIGLSITSGKAYTATTWPGFSYIDNETDNVHSFPGGTDRMTIKDGTNFVLGADLAVNSEFNVLAAWNSRSGELSMSTVMDDGSDPGYPGMGPLSFSKDSMTIAGRYHKGKLQATVGFQGIQNDGAYMETDKTMRSFAGVHYQFSKNLSVRAGSCSGSRDIGALYSDNCWVVNAGYLNKGLNTSNNNSMWLLSGGKLF